METLVQLVLKGQTGCPGADCSYWGRLVVLGQTGPSQAALGLQLHRLSEFHAFN